MTLYTQGVPAEELNPRIEKLQSHLAANNFDGALILQKTDLFYFSGTVQQGWLYIPVQGQPILMIFKEFDRAQAESPLERVVSLLSPKFIPEVLDSHGYPGVRRLGMELDVLPTNLYLQFKTIFSAAAIDDVSTEIRLVRAVKSAYEIKKIRESAIYADRVMARVPQLLAEGKTEIALAGEVESYARSLGHQGLVRMRLWGSELFYGHLMSGASAAVPSYMSSPTGGPGTSPAIGQGSGFKTIASGEPVLVDYVFAKEGYIADQARIFSVGRVDDELLRAHDAMLAVQDLAMARGVPGTVAGDLYEMMKACADDAGYEDFFMGVGERRIRFTGHGLGLELDEFPFIAKGQTIALEAGMTLALEPKVIMPGKGVVGTENTFLVTDNGLEALTTITNAIVSV
ncbi:MAG: Xaa-Pro peptidase family protein [Pseudomonadota bacterium]